MMPHKLRESLHHRRQSSDTGKVDLKLYYHPHSFYSQKVIMALLIKGIPFSTKYVNILNGKQFTTDFLTINPRGEVPVLVDEVRHIPDSVHIIDYLEDNFANGYTRLRPDEPDLRIRCDALSQQLHELKVECLAFGSAVHSIRDLNINPRPPYNIERERAKIREVVEHRKRILRSEAMKFPFAADALNQKLKEVEHDFQFIKNREQYESLILTFEKVLDECEAELASHEDSNWWLVSPAITIADIHLSILLQRLWLLGFEKRMWERTRPYIAKYFTRIRKVESFKSATSMSEGFGPVLELLKNPYTWAAIGTAAAIIGGYYLISNSKLGTGGENAEGFNFFGLFGDCGLCPIHGPSGVNPSVTIAALPAPPLTAPFPETC